MWLQKIITLHFYFYFFHHSKTIILKSIFGFNKNYKDYIGLYTLSKLVCPLIELYELKKCVKNDTLDNTPNFKLNILGNHNRVKN